MRLQLIRASLTGAIAVGALVAAAGVARAERPPISLGFDTLLYTDNDNVIVSSSRVGASSTLDDDGSEVHAAAVVDAVTAASVDVITEATPRFSEVREEADLGGSYAIGRWLPSLHYRYSGEADYISNGGGARVDRRLGEDTTLEAGYDLTYDLIRRSGTSPDVFERTLATHSADASISQVLDRNTVVRLAYSLVGQSGYLAKPYRYVPLFDPGAAGAAAAEGMTLDLGDYDRFRLPERPPENVPTTRLRHAVALRVLRYVDPMNASVRLDYRLYLDDWGVRSHTGELGVRFALGDSVLSLTDRIYEQTAADFWRRTYVVAPGMMPTYRSVDRELSHYVSDSFEVGFRHPYERWAWYGTAAVLYTRYFDFLFLDSRTALTVGGGVQVEL